MFKWFDKLIDDLFYPPNQRAHRVVPETTLKVVSPACMVPLKPKPPFGIKEICDAAKKALEAQIAADEHLLETIDDFDPTKWFLFQKTDHHGLLLHIENTIIPVRLIDKVSVISTGDIPRITTIRQPPHPGLNRSIYDGHCGLPYAEWTEKPEDCFVIKGYEGTIAVYVGTNNDVCVYQIPAHRHLIHILVQALREKVETEKRRPAIVRRRRKAS